MEQKTKLSAAAQKALQITSLRNEASDTVRHSWLDIIGMNCVTVLVPILILVVCAVLVVTMQLPADLETGLVFAVCLVVGMALQSFVALGFADALRKMAAGKDIHFKAVGDQAGSAGRALMFLMLGLILLAASVVPGGAIVLAGLSLQGTWKIVVAVLGSVIAAAALAVVMLSTCLAPFCMAKDEECGAAVALVRSARLMKGQKRQLVWALLPSLLLQIGLAVAMALLLWPLNVKRDFLTDTLMYAGGVAFVIATGYIFMRLQAMLACLFNSLDQE